LPSFKEGKPSVLSAIFPDSNREKKEKHKRREKDKPAPPFLHLKKGRSQLDPKKAVPPTAAREERERSDDVKEIKEDRLACLSRGKESRIAHAHPKEERVKCYASPSRVGVAEDTSRMAREGEKESGWGGLGGGKDHRVVMVLKSF